ncbi:MAG: hypothetical protein HUJ88_13600 [Fusobacterium necrophorum]|nr:hypothetical protein [Fusobacterium necrophorum]
MEEEKKAMKKTLEEIKQAKLDKVKKLQQEIKMIEKKEEEKRIKEFLKELNGLSEQQIEKVRNFIQELKKETV